MPACDALPLIACRPVKSCVKPVVNPVVGSPTVVLSASASVLNAVRLPPMPVAWLSWPLRNWLNWRVTDTVLTPLPMKPAPVPVPIAASKLATSCA